MSRDLFRPYLIEVLPLYIGKDTVHLVITYHWNDDEIHDGIVLQTSGTFKIQVHRGSYNFSDCKIVILNPFSIPILSKIIPDLERGQYWQVTLPLTNYLIKGQYTVRVVDEQKLISEFNFSLMSRKTNRQLFLAETKVILKYFRGKVESLQFDLPPLPSHILTQRTGLPHVKGAYLDGNTIKINNLLGRTQKTITWSVLVQPSYLPLDVDTLKSKPDEFYMFNTVNYEDEAGLELTLLDLSGYDGHYDATYPIQVVHDAINYVHRNMRYVRQQKERGLEYALKYGRGDCTEYSAFLVSILRKLGIKARLVNGLGRSYYNNWISHAFCEIFLYGSWIPVDSIKPPKPYLILGNVGDLIAFSHDNWLDPNNSEFSVQFSAFKGIRPKIDLSRKVTESGVQNLPIKIRQQGLKRLIPVIGSKPIFQLEDNVLRFQLTDKGSGSIFVVQGDPNYGKVVFMEYLSSFATSLDLDELASGNNYWLCIQDKDEVILAFERISI